MTLPTTDPTTPSTGSVALDPPRPGADTVPATVAVPDADAPFRVAGIAAVAGIVRLVESAYRGDASREGWTTEADLIAGRRTDAAMVRPLIVASDGVVLIAGPARRPWACCTVTRRGDDARVGMLAVAPERQGQGIGDRLLAAAERYAAERWRASALTLVVIAQRDDLIAWYERRGFARTGVRERFPYGDERYGQPLRDDLVLHELRRPIDG